MRLASPSKNGRPENDATIQTAAAIDQAAHSHLAQELALLGCETVDVGQAGMGMRAADIERFGLASWARNLERENKRLRG